MQDLAQFVLACAFVTLGKLGTAPPNPRISSDGPAEYRSRRRPSRSIRARRVKPPVR